MSVYSIGGAHIMNCKKSQTCRAPVLAIDPPPHAPALPFKMALVCKACVYLLVEFPPGWPPPTLPPKGWGPIVPCQHGNPQECLQRGDNVDIRIYIHFQIIVQVGIKFASPFGAKFVIALHQPKSTM